MLHQLFDLIGDDHVLFSSDFPHGEGRENAALEIIARKDLTESQRTKLLYDNTARFFGAP
jgi:predicted TIM-barrel fold metal-dependent hydrolase